MELLPHLIWAGVACYAITECCAVVAAFAPAPSSPTTTEPNAPDVPEDLVALAMTEQEAWAQEETLRAMRERYETLRDWQLVRSAFGVGRRD